MPFEKVAAIIAEQMELEADSITPETSLLDDLGADSLDMIRVLTALEETFGVEVPPELVTGPMDELDEAPDDAAVCTVGDLVRYLEEHT